MIRQIGGRVAGKRLNQVVVDVGYNPSRMKLREAGADAVA